MNTLQFYYVHTVLGVSSVIQPKAVRSVYRLLNNSTKKADFLFFCSPVKSLEEKKLIQKMARAIGSSQELILEILNQSINTESVLDNLFTRFLPKGFVIFGESLSHYLIGKEFLLNTVSNSTVSDSTVSDPKLEKSISLSDSSLEKTSNSQHEQESKKPLEVSNLSNQTRLGPAKNLLAQESERHPKSLKNQNRKVTRTVSISAQETLSVPGCVLNPLSDFIGKDSPEIQNTKQQAWNLLRQIFPPEKVIKKEVYYEHST